MSKIYANKGSLEDKILSKYDPMSYAYTSPTAERLGVSVHSISVRERLELCDSNPDFAWACRRTSSN